MEKKILCKLSNYSPPLFLLIQDAPHRRYSVAIRFRLAGIVVELYVRSFFVFSRLFDILKEGMRLHKNHFRKFWRDVSRSANKTLLRIVFRYTRFIDRNFGLAFFLGHFRYYVRLCYVYGIKFLESRNVWASNGFEDRIELSRVKFFSPRFINT